jgi:hypothetical protein
MPHKPQERHGRASDQSAWIGPALFACWTEAQSFHVTIRLSLNRNGEVLGKPAITFSQFGGDMADQKRSAAVA